jgi:hypothetical protein
MGNEFLGELLVCTFGDAILWQGRLMGSGSWYNIPILLEA